MQLVGVDGARLGRWVLASHDSESSGAPRFGLARDLIEVFTLAAVGDALIVSDIPIGILSGEAATAGRTCDAQARKDLGPIRASSVFAAPCREAFGSLNHQQASGRNRLTSGA
jgi:predicted RNase H-like nuclease